MLMLERTDGQRIILETTDGTIEIVLYNLKQGRAAIGIAAPETVKIIRKELMSIKQIL
jgi:sRNA-binding carbon storage regulator CsrA